MFLLFIKKNLMTLHFNNFVPFIFFFFLSQLIILCFLYLNFYAYRWIHINSWKTNGNMFISYHYWRGMQQTSMWYSLQEQTICTTHKYLLLWAMDMCLCIRMLTHLLLFHIQSPMFDCDMSLNLYSKYLK